MFLYYTPGELDAPIYTARSFGPGKKAFYVEWTANAQSCTNMELLSKQLMAQGQFASGNCWPNCGEFDVYEMLVRPQISSSYYGGPFNYGATTLHKGSKTSPCNCPAKGSSQNWYQNTQPMTSGCAAEWQNRPNAKNSLLTIFDEDSNGQFIQMIQDPVITQTGNTASFTMGPTSLATTKIYNNAQEFYGTFPPSSCPQGNPDPSTGWPFYNQEMHLILEEQSYTSQTGISGDTLGNYVVSSVKIFLGDFTGNVSSSTAVPSGTVSGASSASGASSTISGASSASGGSQTVSPTASDTGSTTGDLQLNTAAIAEISFSFVVMLLIACLL